MEMCPALCVWPCQHSQAAEYVRIWKQELMLDCPAPPKNRELRFREMRYSLAAVPGLCSRNVVLAKGPVVIYC
jgi:hypothetical protein